MSDYLMECGYEVFEAGDGQEALDLFHRETPDLVLLISSSLSSRLGSAQDHPEDQLSPSPHVDGLP